MRKKTELYLPVWVVIIAVVLVGVIGLMLTRMGGTGPTGMNSQTMTEFTQGVDKALEQINGALTHADEAGKAADLATLQKHVGLAQSVLKGQDGSTSPIQMMTMMMQGPMMTEAKQGMMGMSMEHHTNMMVALDTAQKSIQSALEHFGEALKADKLQTAQEHVRLAVEQLQAAKGTAGSADPKTGGLTYLSESMAQMKGK